MNCAILSYVHFSPFCLEQNCRQFAITKVCLHFSAKVSYRFMQQSLVKANDTNVWLPAEVHFVGQILDT